MFLDKAEYKEDIERIIGADLPYSKLANSRILLTGASGLFGTILCDVFLNLGQNIEVYALGRTRSKAENMLGSNFTNPKFHFIEQDINLPLTVNVDFDYILHLASNTHPVEYASDPIGSITTNIIGTKNLLDYATQHPVRRFLFASTGEIYGKSRSKDDIFTEDYLGYIDCNTLRASYPEGKRVGESLLNAYNEVHGIDFVIPRICRCYGPTLASDDSKALSQFLRKGVAGEDIVLKSKGEQRFSYAYGSDAVKGILYTLLVGESKAAYNVAGEENLSLREVAELVAKCSGTKVSFELPSEVEQKGFSTADNAILDIAKIKKLGFQADYSLEEGIKRTLSLWQKA